MASKPNANKWSDIQLAIAAVSMTAVIAFWNMFAGPDKAQADKKTAEQESAFVPTMTPTIWEPSLPAATMPPVGYTILFGGVAPQPQVIVVSKPRGNNNKNENTGGSANQPATSTGSS